MKMLYKLKSVFLFSILGIVIIGCQNVKKPTAQEESKANPQKIYVNFAVEGIICSGFEKDIQRKLTALDGIDSAWASHIENQVKIFVDTTRVSLKEIQKAIEAEGYPFVDIIK